MKKIISVLLIILLITGIFGFFVINQITQDESGMYQRNANLPSFFPSQSTMMFILITILLTLSLAVEKIALQKVQINRRKNVIVNFIIFLLIFFAWYFFIFSAGNFSGALVTAAAQLLLGLIVLSMFWLVDHDAGYLFIPAIVWTIFEIILSISLTVLN